MKFIVNVLCFFFILLFSTCAFSKNLIFNQSQLNLGPYLSAYEDSDSSMDAETIISKNQLKDFIQLTQNQPSFGFSNSSFWLTTTVQIETEEQILLEIANPRLDIVDLYLYQEGELIDQVNTGDQKPFSTRPIDHQNFVFPLTFDPKKQILILIKVKSNDSLFLPVSLWDEKTFYKEQSISSLIYGLLYGTLGIMIIINLLISITIKDSNYLLLALFLFFFSLALFSLNGLSNRFLWGEWVWWGKQSLTFLEGIATIFGLIFTRSFLNTSELTPRLDKYLAFSIPVAGTASILAILVEYSWSVLLMSFISLIVPVIVIIAASICWRRKYRPARYFILAWCVFLLGAISYGLMVHAILPSNMFTHFGMHAGLMWLAAMLSLALTDRFNHLKHEKEQAQLAIINQQKITLDFQKRTMNSISRFVPTQFLNLLERVDITDIKYGDAVLKNMFIMFTDIRGFTSLSESMTPKDNFDFLNTYMKFMEPVIEKNKGFVDKFIGDAIMALFPNTADQAVRAAIEMQQKLHLFNHQFINKKQSLIKIGIGIHGGDVMLGTVGSDARLETTVIGAAVNLTSRLEDLTKELQVSIIISEYTFNALHHPEAFTIHALDDVLIRGKKETVKIYQVLVP